MEILEVVDFDFGCMPCCSIKKELKFCQTPNSKFHPNSTKILRVKHIRINGGTLYGEKVTTRLYYVRQE